MPQTHRLAGRRSRVSPLRGDIHRAVIAGCVFAGLFAAAYGIGIRGQAPAARETASALATAQESDDNLTTGSIVFVPQRGNLCRQNLIDNRTWRVRENGTVRCTEALAAPLQRPSRGPAPTRIDIIRNSFRGSPP